MFGAGNNGSRPVVMSREELQARLYAKSDVLSPNKPPQLKAVRLSKIGERSAGSASNQSRHAVEPLPALTSYQKKKNMELLKSPPRRTITDREEKKTPVRKPRGKETTLEPIVRTPSVPSLPEDLLEQQRSLSSRRAQHFHTKSPSSSHRKSTSSIKLNQSTLFLSTDPEMVVTKYSPPLESLVKPRDFVNRLVKEPELGFLYLTPVKGTSSNTHYNPYNLR